jgi:hypothetical protein
VHAGLQRDPARTLGLSDSRAGQADQAGPRLNCSAGRAEEILRRYERVVGFRHVLRLEMASAHRSHQTWRFPVTGVVPLLPRLPQDPRLACLACLSCFGLLGPPELGGSSGSSGLQAVQTGCGPVKRKTASTCRTCHSPASHDSVVKLAVHMPQLWGACRTCDPHARVVSHTPDISFTAWLEPRVNSRMTPSHVTTIDGRGRKVPGPRLLGTRARGDP